jgi:hypothetical protein
MNIDSGKTSGWLSSLVRERARKAEEDRNVGSSALFQPYLGKDPWICGEIYCKS